MIDYLKSALDSLISFFTSIYDFITLGIYDILVWFAANLIELTTVEVLEFKLWVMGFAWDVAQQIVTDLHVSEYLSSAWASLDPEVAGLLSILRVPDALLVVLSGYITRFVLRFLPGL